MADVRAADLPFGSVVATGHHVWIRNTPGVAYPWMRSGDERRWGEMQIDEALANGAEVLRVGDGTAGERGR